MLKEFGNQRLNKFAAKYHPPYRAAFSAKPLMIDLENGNHHYPLYMAYWFTRTE